VGALDCAKLAQDTDAAKEADHWHRQMHAPVNPSAFRAAATMLEDRINRADQNSPRARIFRYFVATATSDEAGALGDPAGEFGRRSISVETAKMTTQIYGESFDGQTIALTVGQTIEVRLQENPTTGFHWQLMANDGAVFAMISDAFKEPSGPPGHGGEHSWIFEAVRPGGCDLEIRYRRRWANSAEPERTFKIHIRVEDPKGGAESGH